MTKMQPYQLGEITTLWQISALPQVPADISYALYQNIRVIALQADCRRLYEALIATRKQPQLDFGAYVHGLVQFKTDLNHMALPNYEAVEEQLNNLHTRFVNGEIHNGVSNWAGFLSEQLAQTSLDIFENDYIQKRAACIAYDTSEGLRDFGNRLKTDRYRVQLADAEMVSEGGALGLMTTQWIDERHNEDRGHIDLHLLPLFVLPADLYKRQLAAEKIAARAKDENDVAYRREIMCKSAGKTLQALRPQAA